jgi:glycosyltransferase involved in cell wall biosynthesis
MHFNRPLISYVLPAYNEAEILESHLDELWRYAHAFEHNYPFEIIIVNDGSSDETGLLADAFASAHHTVKVRHHLTNRGLTAALRTGTEIARGDIIVTLDLDLSYAPYHIGLMLRALEDTNAAMVLASPYMRGGQVINVPWIRKQLSAMANRYLSLATGGKIATMTSMVRAYNATALRALAMDPRELDFNHKLVLAALRKQATIVEVPARLEWRRYPSDAPAQRRSSMKIFGHTWSVLMAGMRYRPSMMLALPGLVPGLLPSVLAMLILVRPSHAVVVDATFGTIAVQILSMAFAAWLAGSYIRRVRSPSRAPAILADGKTESRA